MVLCILWYICTKRWRVWVDSVEHPRGEPVSDGPVRVGHVGPRLVARGVRPAAVRGPGDRGRVRPRHLLLHPRTTQLAPENLRLQVSPSPFNTRSGPSCLVYLYDIEHVRSFKDSSREIFILLGPQKKDGPVAWSLSGALSPGEALVNELQAHTFWGGGTNQPRRWVELGTFQKIRHTFKNVIRWIKYSSIPYMYKARDVWRRSSSWPLTRECALVVSCCSAVTHPEPWHPDKRDVFFGRSLRK